MTSTTETTADIPAYTAALYDLAVKIAQHMPGFAASYIQYSDRVAAHWVMLRRISDGYTLNVGTGYKWNDKGTHIHVNVETPKPATGEHIRNRALQNISARISKKKPPKQIAKEIMRRVVEPSAIHYNEALAMCATYDDRASRQRELISNLRSIGATSNYDYSGGNDEYRMWCGPFTFRVAGDRVYIDRVNGLRGEQMAALIELFRDRGWLKE